MKRILILSPYPEGLAASQRLKYEQYFKSWMEADYDLTTSNFFNLNTWKILYKEGHYFKKLLGTTIGYIKRFKDLSRINKFDIVYIHLWATPIGLPLYEFLLKISGKKLIYDFDDALFEKPDHFSLVNFIKGNFKAKYLIKNAHHLILSSPFLLSHCLKENKYSNAKYIPCSLDTKRFHLKKPQWSKKINIGWTGTFSSKAYLDSIKEVFYELDKIFKIKILLITNFDYSLHGLDYEVIEWQESTEILDLHRIDIGVYPLIKSDWALGKGGLKALQYMAVGIPAISTDFGTVKDFVIDQENGLLVDSTEDWVNAIKKIIENPSLRNNIIINARNTVEKNYSVESNKDKYLAVFKDLLKKDKIDYKN
jgi:glycosyltransferase involved in cell wall biosynthesis